MTSVGNLYHERVWQAYCAWLKTGKADEQLQSIAKQFDVRDWDIVQEHRDHTCD